MKIDIIKNSVDIVGVTEHMHPYAMLKLLITRYEEIFKLYIKKLKIKRFFSKNVDLHPLRQFSDYAIGS